MTAPSASETEAPIRSVERIVPTVRTLEGGGFQVLRPFPGPVVDWIDPFLLLLDELPPNHIEPGEAIGAPAHPHRGFETVTYIVECEVEHRDSAGNHGIIGPGEVQWMTAGDGVVHSEMPTTRMQTEGGVTHGLQLWINLPASLRRTTPSGGRSPIRRSTSSSELRCSHSQPHRVWWPRSGQVAHFARNRSVNNIQSRNKDQ